MAGSSWANGSTWSRAFNVTTIRYDFDTDLAPGMSIGDGVFVFWLHFNEALGR